MEESKAIALTFCPFLATFSFLKKGQKMVKK
jgi:hypothetical protein